MRKGRHAQLPLIESLSEPERAFHPRRRDHTQTMADQPTVVDLLRTIEEMRITADASAAQKAELDAAYLSL